MQREFKGGLFTTILAGDDNRNGKSLELHYLFEGQSNILAEVFLPNADAANTLRLSAALVPFEVIEEFIDEAKIRLTPALVSTEVVTRTIGM